jgi:hypothetical protein
VQIESFNGALEQLPIQVVADLIRRIEAVPADRRKVLQAGAQVRGACVDCGVAVVRPQSASSCLRNCAVAEFV